MNGKKPHIVIVGPGWPYRNGPALYLSHLCKQLSSDFDVTLINYTMLYPGFLFPGKTQYDESEQSISYPNIRMVHSLNPLSWIKTARHINKLNPDVVAFDWWHPFFAPCASGIITFLNGKLKKKVLFITENVISHEANKPDKILTNLALSKAKAFLALSNAVKEHLSGWYKTKVFRSELPIYDVYKSDGKDTSAYRKSFGFKEDDIVLLFFGLVRKYKGLDLLLEAFADCVQEDPRLKLLVVGEFYEDPESYLSIIKNRGIEQSVTVENRFVANEEVERYVEASDVIALPYRSATQSGVLNVAYGFYKPAIVTNVGELKALVEENKTGIVIDKATVEDIKAGIKKFVQQKEQGTPFAAHIKDYIANRHTFTQVNGVFKDIVAYLRGN